MESKIQETFIDYGCGFPVVLLNVPMIRVYGKWTPDINYNELEQAIILALCHKSSKLTGSEIRFIRLYFEMTLHEFGKRFGVRHPTVVKWENFKDEPTNMTRGTEKDIRLFIIHQLKGSKKVGELYRELEQNSFSLRHEEPIQLDIEKFAI